MRNEIDNELGNWDEDGTIVKEKIYSATINHIVRKRFYKWRPFVVIATTLLLVVGAYFMLTIFSSEQIALKERNEQSNFLEDLNNKNSSETNSDDITNPIVINTSFEPRELDEISFKIAAYDTFYYDNTFHSAKEAKKEAAEKLYRWITAINFAEERNIVLSESELSYVQGLSNAKIRNLKSNPSKEKYLNNVLAAFQITEEEYLEYYLYIGDEAYGYESKLHELEVNMTQLYELYSDIPEEYYEKAGITLAEAKEIDAMWEQIWAQSESRKVTERQFNLPFDLTGSSLNIIQLDDGKYVFENPKYFGLYETKYGPFLENYLNKRNNMLINRTSLDDMIDYLLNLDTDYEPYRQSAREVAEVYKVLKQSIDWELN